MWLNSSVFALAYAIEVSDRNGVDQMKAAVAENVRFGKEAKKIHLGSLL